jgi:hypothetical protein
MTLRRGGAMLDGPTMLIALTAAVLTLSAASAAHADQTTDDRDRAVVAHSRDRTAARTRPPGTSADSAPVAAPVQDPQLSCDRICLQSAADAYLKAVVAHDPKLLGLDEHFRFTENGQELQAGDGFWNTASGVGAAQQFYPDPQTQQITYIGTMREFDNLVLMAMRLKVHDRRISEVETLFYRKGAGPAWSDAGVDATNTRGTADAAWLTPIPAAQRAPREQLSAVAMAWMNALGHYDGKAALPVGDDCVRFENGSRVSGNPKVQIGDGRFNLAALGCRQQLQSGFFASVSRIHHRRVVAVDPDNGTVVVWANLDQAGMRELHLADGHILSLRALAQPASTQAVLVFRIEGGTIRRIQMLTVGVPYHMNPGWDEPATP